VAIGERYLGDHVEQMLWYSCRLDRHIRPR
jgi:hypothetical protein